MKKKLVRRISLLLMAGIAILLVFYMVSINRADEKTIEAMEIDYRLVSGTYHVPSEDPQAQVVFYPGALVETEAYLPLAAEIASHGFDVYIPKMPFHLAILDSNAVSKIAIDEEMPVYIGGHSLGGVAALEHLNDNKEAYDGLFLIASYPQPSVDLSSWDEPVLSITASKDGVMDIANYQEALERLPDHTLQHEIEGANHANFGNYGKQRFDQEAEITRSEQQTITANKISAMISNDLE
ncbi:MAG: alpha/beta hydrolase [Bacillota bacterium]